MINRIEQLIDALGITQKDFAQQIGTSAAALSHITSGRNRPSLELVLKILNKHPNVNSDWLLFGKGSMVKQHHKDIQDNAVREVVRVEYKHDPKPIDHITVFYDDNTYCTFYPKQNNK